MPEWPKGADCKSAGIAYVGSNPARPTTKRPIAIAIGRLCFFAQLSWPETKARVNRSSIDDHFWFAVLGESGDLSEVTNA